MRFTSILSAAIFATTVIAAPRSLHASRLARRNEQTDDWAGAVVKSSPDDTGFITVIGTFNVPGNFAEADVASAVSIWVGGDGYTNGDPVVQAGVDIILDEDGDATYKAWTEWTPNPPTYISESDFPFTSGDSIKVQVSFNPGATSATAIFTNSADSEHPFFANFNGDVAFRGQQVEWIVERIHGGPNSPPEGNLLDFGTLLFTECAASTAKTPGGAADTFPGAQGTAVDMLNAEGGVAAQATISSNDVATVQVSWKST